MAWFKPLAEEAFELEPGFEGIEYGIPSLDAVLGPMQPSLLHLLIGYSHNGKTQLLLTLIRNNPDKRVVLFTPDETVRLVLPNLMQVLTGIPREEAVFMGADVMRGIIEQHVPNLAICEDTLNIPEMGQYVDEYLAYYDAESPDLIVYDYLECLPDTPDTRNQANLLKSVAKKSDCPWLVLHQASRSGGAGGKPLVLSSMAFGGEQQAHTVVGVYRKINDPDLSPYDQEQERLKPTINVSVLKNKQRAKVTDPVGISMLIDRGTGEIYCPDDEDEVDGYYSSLDQLRR